MLSIQIAKKIKPFVLGAFMPTIRLAACDELVYWISFFPRHFPDCQADYAVNLTAEEVVRGNGEPESDQVYIRELLGLARAELERSEER